MRIQTGFHRLFQGLVLAPLVHSAVFNDQLFNQVAEKMKQDALDLAAEVERLYGARCDPSTYTLCESSNYNECSSQYPNTECLGSSFARSDCTGDVIDPQDGQCSGLFDFSSSSVRFPPTASIGPGGNPNDPAISETVCFTKDLDIWWQARRNQDEEYWSSVGIRPLGMHFGSITGAFRIWPARQSKTCGAYDPRVRPWYVAGGSGPKNVVLIIDVSNSMNDFGALQNAKDAATRVVQTLTVSDRITIVPFSDSSRAMVDEVGFMFQATEKNKENLISQIDALEAVGNTNFYAAFEKAFEVMEKSISEERLINCNSAILFLTDGTRTEGPSLEDVTTLVTSKISLISNALSKPVVLFTYSLSTDPDVHEYPRALAQEVETGVWTKISFASGVTESLSSYYRLFALGLGSNENRDFAAWVEPYNFATGGILGTTVSVPVYDRNQDPPLFLGVVGVDFPIHTIDETFGDGSDDTREKSIQKIIERSDRACPIKLELTPCELLAWSSTFEFDESQNSLNCTGDNAVVVSEPACPEELTYPADLFHNRDLEDIDFTSRVCCILGTTVATDQCPATTSGSSSSSSNALAIALPVAIGGCLIIVALVMFYQKRRNKKGGVGIREEAPPPAQNPALARLYAHASAPPGGLTGRAPPPISGSVNLPPESEL